MFRVRDVLRETDPVVTDWLDSVAQICGNSQMSGMSSLYNSLRLCVRFGMNILPFTEAKGGLPLSRHRWVTASR